VNLPISNTSIVVKMDKGPVGKETGSIDIANIVNFHNAGTKTTKQATQAGTIVSIGDNPNVVVSSRLQSPSNEWVCYIEWSHLRKARREASWLAAVESGPSPVNVNLDMLYV
jgi:hypothetical protein